MEHTKKKKIKIFLTKIEKCSVDNSFVFRHDLGREDEEAGPDRVDRTSDQNVETDKHSVTEIKSRKIGGTLLSFT